MLGIPIMCTLANIEKYQSVMMQQTEQLKVKPITSKFDLCMTYDLTYTIRAPLSTFSANFIFVRCPISENTLRTDRQTYRGLPINIL